MVQQLEGTGMLRSCFGTDTIVPLEVTKLVNTRGNDK